MNETSQFPQPSHATPAPAGDDPRPVLGRAMAVAATVIAGIGPDDMANPTPCETFDVRHLLAHATSVLDRLVVMGNGGDVLTVPIEAEIVADDTWVERWATGARAVEQAWSDDAVLDGTIQLPWTRVPGRDAIAIYVNEITVHTWDLARATGQRPAWDDEAVQLASKAVHDQLPTAERAALWAEFAAGMPEGVPFEPPFQDAVPQDDDAPAIDRLVAWNGRRP